jgi:hypothetical protein
MDTALGRAGLTAAQGSFTVILLPKNILLKKQVKKIVKE